MNKKKLILSSVSCLLAVGVLLILLMPIVEDVGFNMFDLISNVDKWYLFEEYLWGIGAIISLIVSSLLILSLVLTILSAIGVIKSKKLDLILYIVNIVLAVFLVCVIVNFTLGLGASISEGGVSLFKGTTYFKYTTAFFYLHCAFSIATLVLCCMNKNKNK